MPDDRGRAVRPAVGLVDLGAFLAELALVGTLVAVGVLADGPRHLGLVAAVVLPVALIVVWGRWLAPRAHRRLGRPGRVVLKVALTIAVAVLLAAVGHVLVAAVLAAAEIVLLVAGEVGAAPSGEG